MFESVAPETFVPRSRRVFYETLPISIAVHVIGFGAAFATVFWNVAFPTQSPRMVATYNLTQVPDPPPPPPKPEPPKPAGAAPKLAPPPPAAPTQIVAPTVIPDAIPDVVPPPPPAPPPEPTPAVVVPTPALVDAAGSANGVAGGQPGGVGHTLGGSKGITFGNDGRVYVDRTVKLPLKEVVHEFPHYPEAARKNRLEGTCVVRYTVGKNGNIADVTILNHAADPMFDEETLNTIRSWRYRPMMVNGKPVEVVHEVEVNYQYIVR